jgi:hypothetical protein
MEWFFTFVILLFAAFAAYKLTVITVYTLFIVSVAEIGHFFFEILSVMVKHLHYRRGSTPAKRVLQNTLMSLFIVLIITHTLLFINTRNKLPLELITLTIVPILGAFTISYISDDEEELDAKSDWLDSAAKKFWSVPIFKFLLGKVKL